MSKNTQIHTTDERSYFDGGFWGQLGYSLLTVFVTSITFGIAFPWMYCLKQRWIAKHTVVCGKRMRFDGTGVSLIGHWLLWYLLTILTLGIYGHWMGISLRKWITKHTHYEGEPDKHSYFDGGVGGLIGINLLCFLLTVCTFGIAAPWASVKKMEWEARHTVIDSRRHVFVGTGGNLFVKRLLWGFLTVITFGIYGLWLPIKGRKWTVENTIDNEHTTDALIRRGEYRAAVQATAANLHAQRVQDGMELIQNGITATTDEATLLAMAQTGCRSAQFEYVRRYARENYTVSPYAEFLKSSADQGYAPAMCVYALSGAENVEEMLAGAAKNGQIPAVLKVMRNAAKAGLTARDDSVALPSLQEAVRWYDVLATGEEAVTKEDTTAYTRCMMKIRRILAKAPPKRMTAGKIIGFCLLAIFGGVVLGLIISAAISLFAKITPSFGGNDGFADSSSGSGGFFSQIFGNKNGDRHTGNAMIDSNMAGAWNGSGNYGDHDEDYKPVGGTDYATFREDFIYAMENDPQYYTVESIDAEPGVKAYSLKCNHYYWSSSFEIRFYTSGDDVTRIVLTGPRVYDTEEENMNGLEFQGIARVLYNVLGLGDLMDITPDIDPGMDYTDYYPGWDFHYSLTDDTLTLDIQANAANSDYEEPDYYEEPEYEEPDYYEEPEYEEPDYEEYPDDTGDAVGYMTFLDAFRYTMEDVYYYTVQSIAAGDGQEIFELRCNHYYWSSYFEMTVYTQNGVVTEIVLTGPRVYETIDENINAWEFQSAARVIYMSLGLGGEMDITPPTESGADYSEYYNGWTFYYYLTDDTLTLDVIAP